jgi:hypothetical protein
MMKVKLNETLYRGPGYKHGESRRYWHAAGWSIRSDNVARVVPDNWRLLC